MVQRGHENGLMLVDRLRDGPACLSGVILRVCRQCFPQAMRDRGGRRECVFYGLRSGSTTDSILHTPSCCLFNAHEVLPAANIELRGHGTSGCVPPVRAGEGKRCGALQLWQVLLRSPPNEAVVMVLLLLLMDVWLLLEGDGRG